MCQASETCALLIWKSGRVTSRKPSLTVWVGHSALTWNLQGGKEAKHSNRVLHDIIVSAIEEEAPEVGRELIGLVISREGVSELLVHDDVIDLVIPRGSNALVSAPPDCTPVRASHDIHVKDRRIACSLMVPSPVAHQQPT